MQRRQLRLQVEQTPPRPPFDLRKQHPTLFIHLRALPRCIHKREVLPQPRERPRRCDGVVVCDLRVLLLAHALTADPLRPYACCCAGELGEEVGRVGGKVLVEDDGRFGLVLGEFDGAAGEDGDLCDGGDGEGVGQDAGACGACGACEDYVSHERFVFL